MDSYLLVTQRRQTFLFGVSRKGRVIQAPPIARWALHKNAEKVRTYYESRGAEVTEGYVDVMEKKRFGRR